MNQKVIVYFIVAAGALAACVLIGLSLGDEKSFSTLAQPRPAAMPDVASKLTSKQVL